MSSLGHLQLSARGTLRALPFIALLALAGCDGGQKTESAAAAPAPEVGVYAIEARELSLTTELPGRTTAYRIAEVRPQVNGIIQKRLFTEGAEVKQGQQLYQIDAGPYKAALARAEANAISAKNLAKRYERLIKTSAVSQQQYDDAIAAWKSAQAALEVARIDMQYTKVLSPISGRIGRSLVSEGALVTNGQAQEMATVTQLDPIYVDFTQPAAQMLRLQRAYEAGVLENVGDEAIEISLTLEDGSAYPLKGKLQFSEVAVDHGTGSVTLRAEFPNPERKLLPGLFVQARLQEGVQSKALLVPQQAVQRDGRGVANVWVVKADNTVERREIETLRTVGNTWLVGEGLEAGERVVAEGIQRVRAGIEVKPVEPRNLELVTTFEHDAS